MAEPYTAVSPDYRAAYAGAVVYDETSAGRIYMRGRDRASLLQRLSTNDIMSLQPGEGARTVLTTPIGRTIDLLTVYALTDALLLITSSGQGGPVYTHLRKNIFFNDQVTLEAAGRSHGQLALYGPRAAEVIEQVAGAAAAQLPLHHTSEVRIGNAPVLLARRLPICGYGYTLFVRADELSQVREVLLAAGAAPLTPGTFESLRIEHGYPAFGRELSQEYIPLETGLLDAISFTKGCYVGQEIIARMESRGRIARRLRGLRLSEPVDAPGRLEVDGKEAGELTSALVSPTFGPIGLAYLRTTYADVGTLVAAAPGVQGKVCELPFVERPSLANS